MQSLFMIIKTGSSKRNTGSNKVVREMSSKRNESPRSFS